MLSDTDHKLAKNPLRLHGLTTCTRIARGLRKAVFPLLQWQASERWMSGLSRTPGKRVWVNSPPRVRIPPAPPETQ